MRTNSPGGRGFSGGSSGQHWTYKTGCLPVGAGIFGRLGSPRALTPGGEIECRVGSRDQRYFQGWPLDSPHVCHGIRHAGCPTLHSLASLLCSEFKPKVHGEGLCREKGELMQKRRQRQSRFRTTHSSLPKKVLSRNSLAEMKKKKKTLVFHTIPLGAILYHFAKNWICLPKSSTAIGSARV